MATSTPFGGLVAAAASLLALTACSADVSTGRSGPAGARSSATATAEPLHPYVVARHQVDPGLLGLRHADGELWATRPGGLTRIDPHSGTSTPVPDYGQVGDAHDFAVGAGHVWVPDFERASLTRIRIEDLRVERLPVLKNSDAATYGFGAVWVSNHRSSSVQRLDPSTGQVVATVPVGTGLARCCGPSAALAAFGRVWVAVPFLRGLVAIDPTTNRVVETVVVDDGGCSICGDLAATGEGTAAREDDAVWGVGDTALHRIDPHRAARTASVPLQTPENSGSEGELAATPFGVFVSAARGRLLRVDVRTASVHEEIVLHPAARNVQWELAQGGGRLWAYERYSGVLSAMDPTRARPSAGSPSGG